MKKIDTNLLKWFQKISDWLQIQIGVNNFHAAKIFMILAFGSMIEVNIVDGWTIFSIFGIAVGGGLYFFITHRIKVGEKNCHQNPVFESTLSYEFEPMRKYMIYFCIIRIIMFLFQVFEKKHSYTEILSFAFFAIGSIVETIGIYFASCTPKPKSPSKLKQWLGNTNLKPQLEQV